METVNQMMDNVLISVGLKEPPSAKFFGQVTDMIGGMLGSKPEPNFLDSVGSWIEENLEVLMQYTLSIGVALAIPLALSILYRRFAQSKTVIQTRYPVELTESVNRGIKFKSQFIQTSFGRTYTEQWTTSKKHGHHMLLIHGFSMADWMTMAFAPFIVDKIKNTNDIKLPIRSVTAIHLYGRGFSDCPLVPYTRSLFTSQIRDIMFSLDLDGRIILCGVSMGGAIVADFANMYPQRIHKLVTLAPKGCTPGPPLQWKLVALLVFGDLLITLGASKLMQKLEQSISSELNVEKFGEAAKQAVKQHVNFLQKMHKHDGYLYALLSTLRHFGWKMKDVFNQLYERTDFENKRWLFIWGTHDVTCPIKGDDMFPDVKIIKVDGGKHCDVVEEYCIVQYANEFIDWLNA